MHAHANKHKPATQRGLDTKIRAKVFLLIMIDILHFFRRDSTHLHSHWKHCQNISINMSDKDQQSPFGSITASKIKSTPTITPHWGHLLIKSLHASLSVCVWDIWLMNFTLLLQDGWRWCYCTTKWGQACEAAPSDPSFHHFYYSSDRSSSRCHF